MNCCSCVKKVFFIVDGGELFDTTIIEKYDCGGMDDCVFCAELANPLKDGCYVGVLDSSVWADFNGESTEYYGGCYITHARRAPIRGLIWTIKRKRELKRLGFK